MAAREVCFLISKGGTLLWSDASTTAWALPDSRERWEAIWSQREDLSEIVHSHPGGPLGFSTEDVTTMDAIDAALGRPLSYGVVAPNGVIVRDAKGIRVLLEEPWWAAPLRRASEML